jgi:hypothetical protein
LQALDDAGLAPGALGFGGDNVLSMFRAVG